MNWNILVEKACNGERLTRPEAEEILHSSDEQLLPMIDAAYKVRKQFFGKRVKLNFLLNAKSGLCPEDCLYCSQSKVSDAAVDKYPFLTEKEVVEAAKRAVSVKARRFCMVNSGRGPTDNEIKAITSAVAQVKNEFPSLEVCVCLGILEPHQGKSLKDAGVDAYNHNLNTSENYYSSICTTHTYQDRVDTVNVAKASGLSPCSGCLFGMGEKDEDIIQMAFTMRRTGVDSIPLNFLIPIAGTPFENFRYTNPRKCLRILSLFRFTNPQAEIRIAGGREVNLRWLQPFGLYIANSIFIGDYLTTKGQKPEADLAMIEDLGFEIEGYEPGKPQAQPDPAEFAVEMR